MFNFALLIKNEFMKNNHLLRNTISIVFAFFFHNFIFAQQNENKIIFPEESYNFGTLQESDGEVQHTFKFVNVGSDSLKLVDVQSSCGCTTPYWEKTALLPGDTGHIVVAFNPLNKPGGFEKTVTVTSNGTPPISLLTISGFVEPRSLTIEDKLPFAIGDLRFKSQYLNFGTITTEKPVQKSFAFFNQSEDTISFLERQVAGDFIQLQLSPKVVPPKSYGQLMVTYITKKRNDFGFLNDQIMLFTDEDKDHYKALSIIATVMEYFPPMTERELARAPRLQVEEDTYDFGHVNVGEVLTHSFLIQNTGKDKLNIRKMKPTCNCLQTELKERDFKGGSTGEIKVTFDTAGTGGSQVKRVTVFSNDPRKPAKDLILKAYVRE
ncbi:hypothetical protein GCM10011506_44870 [Marivirga lumbricoides]|uniref:DUF1573 domain-containing protein n=2 Tax=Marivirga lumbricoides TaxID=1046115 RepID=A0ABQ1N5G7_9BACT|nr:hypothetical protein GCM10011506_44870 [Marivirga lumbricoides]